MSFTTPKGPADPAILQYGTTVPAGEPTEYRKARDAQKPCFTCSGKGSYETCLYLMGREKLQTITCGHCKGTGISPAPITQTGRSS